MTAILDAALTFAARGWPVFPCNSVADKSKGKQPLVARGFKAASTDPETIRAWWREYPDALIGLPTGRDLGAFVVDLDPREDDCETLWRKLEEHVGAGLGDPVVAVTQSGGWHLYFAWPDLPQGAKLGNRGGLIRHVDVRGAGGYVIAPPSVMSDGRAYSWRKRADGERGLTEAPAALVDAILRRGVFAPGAPAREEASVPDDRVRRWALAAMEGEVRRAADAPAGERNETLNRAAFRLGQIAGAGALPEAMVRAALEDVASAWPNLKKSRGTIESGLKAGIAEPCDLGAVGVPRMVSAPAPAPAEAAVEADEGRRLVKNQHDPWLNPDLSLLDETAAAPLFPSELLGEMWAGWIDERAKAASAPADYVAVSLLACAAGVLANVRWPVVGAGWSEPSHLWMCLVGHPASGKSPGMGAALALLDRAEDQMMVGFDERVREYKTREAYAKVRKELWERAVDAAAKQDEEPPKMPTDAEAPDRIVLPRIRVADATPEKLAELSAGQPRGLVLVRDEVAGWLGSFDKYGGAGGDRAFALESWNGGRYGVDRKKAAEPVNVRHLSVGVLGGIQPERLAPIIAGPDDGLVTRFLYAWPNRFPPFRIHREPIDDGPALDAFGRLARLAMGSDKRGNPEPKRLPLTADAALILEEFASDVARQADAFSGPLSGALGKARGHALRLSCVVEHLRWCANPSLPGEPEEIRGPAAFAAVRLMEAYFLPTSRRVFIDAAAPALDQAAAKVARYLRRNAVPEFTFRELRQRMNGELREMDILAEALADLEEAGLVRRRMVSRRPSGGRPPRLYDVHPALSRARVAKPVR